MTVKYLQNSKRWLIPTYCAVFLLFLTAMPVFSQELLPTPADKENAEAQWQPPDITNLSLTWWSSVESSSADSFQQRMEQFEAFVRQQAQGLTGQNLLSAQNLIGYIKGQAELIVLALRNPEPTPFEPIPTQESYTLDELLDLRKQWRDIQDQRKVPELRVEELQNQSALLETRRDDLLEQYEAADTNSPARILHGLERVAARLDFELTARNLKYQQKRLTDLQQRSELLDQQLDYAESKLDDEETDWSAIENEATVARDEAAEAAEKLSTVRHQLLEVLSATEPKPSLELLRKQQLTRAAAMQTSALVQANLDTARANWYRVHAGTLDSDFDINVTRKESGDLIATTGKQVEVWTSASQTTLITPLPESGLNARKNVELAHTAAQETLSIIKEIENGIDDLTVVQRILTTDTVDTQSGLRRIWTRLTLLTGNLGDGLSRLLNFDIFHIGDAPVTPGAIVKMLMIVVFGFLLSWAIRHLLERLESRRKYAKSSVVYTLGRILHYIIIIAAVFAALGTIGLDFTNFALIAGALSVGIGFGLQSIVNNFVSGLILLFEGSLRVGDYVELDNGLRGTVKEINTRATVINTNDSIDVVVPNSEFVTARLTNWTLRDPIARLRIDFGVAYGSDKELVKQAALEAAGEVEFILQHTPGREAQVWLTDFGESSLNFELLAWVSKSGVRRPNRTRSQFLWALETKLNELGIEIPFPQRDLHLRSGFVQGPRELDSADENQDTHHKENQDTHQKQDVNSS